MANKSKTVHTMEGNRAVGGRVGRVRENVRDQEGFRGYNTLGSMVSELRFKTYPVFSSITPLFIRPPFSLNPLTDNFISSSRISRIKINSANDSPR